MKLIPKKAMIADAVRARLDLEDFIADIMRHDAGRSNRRLAKLLAEKIIEREFGGSFWS